MYNKKFASTLSSLALYFAITALGGIAPATSAEILPNSAHPQSTSDWYNNLKGTSYLSDPENQ